MPPIHEIHPYDNTELNNEIIEFFKFNDIDSPFHKRIDGITKIFGKYCLYVNYFVEYVSFIYKLIHVYIKYNANCCKHYHDTTTPLAYSFHVKGMNVYNPIHRELVTQTKYYRSIKDDDFIYNLQYSTANFDHCTIAAFHHRTVMTELKYEDVTFTTPPLYFELFGYEDF
ncbi:MAG: hypothetical protein ACRCZI_07665 [Cetobacterium sp.]